MRGGQRDVTLFGEKIGAVGEKGSLQKGREVFVNEKREKKKSRIGWKPPPPPSPSEMNI